MTRHPIQPLEFDDRGVLRFKKNEIVEYLLDNSLVDLNALALKFHDPEYNDDRAQFAQLIGYSLSGWGDLSYVDDKAWTKAVRKGQKVEKKRT